jgi:hypothetical protein
MRKKLIFLAVLLLSVLLLNPGGLTDRPVRQPKQSGFQALA